MPTKAKKTKSVSRSVLSLSIDEAVVIYQRRNWRAASPFATHDVNGRRYKYGNGKGDGLDPGIAPFVKVLYDNGVETCESCQGGHGHPENPRGEHAYPEPTIVFYGGPEAGMRAYAVARAFDLPVKDVRRVWRAKDHELTGPYWQMTFERMATDEDRKRLRHAPDPRVPHNPSRRANYRTRESAGS
jgi:hypothetical protein